MALTVSRKQRLRTLENNIRKAAEEIQKNGLEIGRDLCEIRDEELWADECESWNQYLKDRAETLVGRSWASSIKLIQAAEVQKKLPTRFNVESSQLEANHLAEISRLAPQKPKDDGRGMEKDYSKLRTQDVSRVLKTATELAKEKDPESEGPSVRDVRKAVDQELGIDRTAKSAETKERQRDGIDLPDYLRASLGRIQGITNNLAKVPGESWTLLEDSDPGLVTRVAEACEELAELLRS